MHIGRCLHIGSIQLYWLRGGDFRLDGGAMFGAVPKILWGQKYPVDQDNCIPLCNDPLLIRTPENTILVDSGLGNKLSDKQKRVYQVSGNENLISQLEALGVELADVQHLILTHCDFDHAGGIETRHHDSCNKLTFPNAVHHLQQKEWEDVESPHLRAKSTYLNENFSSLRKSDRLHLLDGDQEICQGVTLRATGGHTRGHQLVEICSDGQMAVHLGDLFPTHVHSNPLWGMAYDNFPLEVIDRKKEFFDQYIPKECWFTFYHDPFVRACRLDRSYRVIDRWSDIGEEERDGLQEWLTPLKGVQVPPRNSFIKDKKRISE